MAGNKSNAEKSEISFAVVTVSDSCYNKTATDSSGPHLQQLIFEKFGSKTEYSTIIPDDQSTIQSELIKLADTLLIDVIFTSGGTGFAPRDVTPEATKAVIEKDAPQLALLMGLKSLEKTKFAILSRAVCGIRGKTLIVNFPGSKKAVEECFLAIADVIKHAVEIITNQTKCIREVHDKLKSEKAPGHICPHEMGTGGSDRKSTYALIDVRDALDKILSVCSHFRSKPKEISSFINLPPFRASVKDGYAVKFEGGLGIKKVKGYINAGDETVKDDFGPDECYKINTGASIPHYCDAIIQIEDTELVSKSEKGIELEVKLLRAPLKNEDIRQIGSDIQFGELLFQCHEPISAPEYALAAACGQNIESKKAINVAIISTGDELVPPGANLLDGQIYDSNTIMLKKLLNQFGFHQIETLLAKDSYSDLKKMVQYALENNQFVICSGGVSMGDKDFVKPVLKDLGFEIAFGRVNMKPGKPFTFAHKKNERLFFGLPGNPVSVFATFHVFVLPALRFSQNWREFKCKLPVIQVELKNESIDLDPRPEYVRATVSSVQGKLYASVTGDQISSRLKSLIDADVLLHLPASSKSGDTVKKGAILEATVLKHDFISEYK